MAKRAREADSAAAVGRAGDDGGEGVDGMDIDDDVGWTQRHMHPVQAEGAAAVEDVENVEGLHKRASLIRMAVEATFEATGAVYTPRDASACLSRAAALKNVIFDPFMASLHEDIRANAKGRAFVTACVELHREFAQVKQRLDMMLARPPPL